MTAPALSPAWRDAPPGSHVRVGPDSDNLDGANACAEGIAFEAAASSSVLDLVAGAGRAFPVCADRNMAPPC